MISTVFKNPFVRRAIVMQTYLLTLLLVAASSVVGGKVDADDGMPNLRGKGRHAKHIRSLNNYTQDSSTASPTSSSNDESGEIDAKILWPMFFLILFAFLSLEATVFFLINVHQYRKAVNVAKNWVESNATIENVEGPIVVAQDLELYCFSYSYTSYFSDPRYKYAGPLRQDITGRANIMLRFEEESSGTGYTIHGESNCFLGGPKRIEEGYANCNGKAWWITENNVISWGTFDFDTKCFEGNFVARSGEKGKYSRFCRSREDERIEREQQASTSETEQAPISISLSEQMKQISNNPSYASAN